MDVWEAIKGRRSVRRFADRPVERERLERLVEAAIWAPSAGNAQTWRFVIVADKESALRIKTVSPGLLGDPAALVAICQDLAEARRRSGTLGETFLAPVDAAMAAQNLLLAAHAEGLGACVIASFHRRAVARLLALESEVEPILLVSVGWPAEAPPPPPRRRDCIAFAEVTDDAR